MTSTGIEQEALESYARFVALRDEVDAGRRRWAEMADFFTEDAAYIDPAWGRIEGREPIRRFFEESMAGLTGHGWSTRENWTMADGHRVVSQWDQVLGERQDGTPCFVAGLSILYYAGSGLFCYGHDLLNMTHIVDTLGCDGVAVRPKASTCRRPIPIATSRFRPPGPTSTRAVRAERPRNSRCAAGAARH